jgi:AcrR family transcriptional regulator
MTIETNSVPKKEDRRSARSKRLILQALRDLVLEKDYKQISVTDIVERADVGRATFYAHFEDKAALGRFIFGALLAEIEQELERILSQPNSNTSLSQKLAPSLALFRIGQAKHLYFKANGLSPEIGLNMLIDPLTRRFEQQARAAGIDESRLSIPLSMTARYSIAALVALLTDWIMEDMPQSPEEMDRIYQGLIRPTIQALSSDNQAA